MKVLVVGAEGFIGRHVVRALREADHDVVRATRKEPGPGKVSVDLARDTRDDWIPRLAGVEAVVNAAGIFRERRGETFTALHDTGARALFAACETARVRKVVQISALGADERAASRFHLSKKRADEDLAGRALAWIVVQPSLVYGTDGASARLFTRLASLPIVPLPGDGLQQVQPIHVEDLTALVVRLLEGDACVRMRIPAVGPRAVSLREWLAVLRSQVGLGAARFVRVPLFLVRSVIGAEALGMLMRGNTAPTDAMERCLGRRPRPIEAFVQPVEARAVRLGAKLGWLLALLRLSVASVWIATGILSLGLYPASDSLALIARVGLVGAMAYAALYAGAMLDIVLGVAVYAASRRKWVWRLQGMVMLAYTAIISLALPEFWLHPFGPLLKNVPLLAAIVLLHEMEEA